MKLLIDFIEDRVSPSDFLNLFYEDEELQAVLEKETNICPYTNCGNLCLFIFEVNASNLGSVLNLKDALKQYLQKKNVAFTCSDKTEKNYDIFLTAIPKWLIAPSEYFSTILDNDTLSKAEKKEQIKIQVKKIFRCLKTPPKWIQPCNWPISNDKPLVFVGQLELDVEIFHDKGAVYVFLDTATGEIETIKQFY